MRGDNQTLFSKADHLNTSHKESLQMLISQVSQNPLTPNDIVCFWDKVKVLEARTVETANPGVPVQVLHRLLQEVLVLLQQVYSLKVLKRDNVK